MWEGGVGPFLPSLVTYRGWRGPKYGPFWTKLAKHGRPVSVPKWSKRDQNGQPKCFWPFGTTSDKNEFLSQMDKIGFGRGASALGAKKINFFLNEFEFFTTPIFTYLTSPWNAHFHTSSEALFVSGFVNTFPPRFPFQIGFTVSNIQIQGFNKD